ncbi:MFS transporter [Gulosibacter macacae]|uniref:MFS transporter n=1 Tax=Gulosibacter macacae TaxID=2488791 RepID=A0A3P3VX69_9MICO|nr:MFS transporter [Gulosibacter macacae]RRJ87064.1 MFS transporter [Gulosibacter macacae]
MTLSTKSIWGIVGALAFVELTSGILQGYYTPFLTDIARHYNVHDADVNWLEGAQLMLAALLVPAFAKLGDRVGHRRMLLISAIVTALASFGLVVAPTWGWFLVAWALQGAYVVWLPLEIALVWARSRGGERPAATTAKAAGVLVAALEIGAIVGALGGGALIDALPLQTVLLIPAIAVTICAIVIGLFVRDLPAERERIPFDLVGLTLISLALLALTGGLSLLRLDPAMPLAWLCVAAGIALIWPFARWELRHADPLIDVRMFRNPALWPVFLTAGLFGMSVLGAQAPLSTFARTDPDAVGYGLGTTGFATSLIIGAYVLTLAIGALLYPLAARATSPRLTLAGAVALVGLGYLMFLPFHDSYGQVITNMVIAGLGSGALVAALPATAAAAAPDAQTGVATGLTNSVKTVGGAIASCVFGLALMQGAAATAGSFAGYVTVWVVCAVSAFVAAACLLFVVPRGTGAFEAR